MKISTTHAANGANSVAVPATAGIYFVRVTAANGEVITAEKVTVR